MLVDPPFEAADEFARLGEALPAAARKWPGGVYMVWYPVKDRSQSPTLSPPRSPAVLRRAASGSALRLELGVDAAQPGGRLARSGLIIANPPFSLEAEARIILPRLSRRLGGAGADHLIAPASS